MSDQRSRGKNVVLDSLPVSVNTSGSRANKSTFRSSKYFNKAALHEVLFVLFGLVFVVWLFFGGSKSVAVPSWSAGNRKVVNSLDMNIVPHHYLGANGGRDSVKKAPGDKKSTSISDSNVNEKAQSVLYKYVGSSTPRIVLLTVLEDKMPRDLADRVIENRLEYSLNFGYGVLIKYVSEFQKFVDESNPRSDSWVKVAIGVEAQFTFPEAEWFWYLDSSVLITNSELDIAQILKPESLSNEFLGGVSVVKNFNSHVQTLRNPNVKNVVFVSSLDTQSRIHDQSFFFANTIPGQIFMQSWGEVLLRTCDRIDGSVNGLQHLIQWHPQYLSRILLLPNKFTGTYVDPVAVDDFNRDNSLYRQGDLAAVFSCDINNPDCKRKQQTIWNERVKPMNAGKKGAPKVAKDSVQNQVQVEAQEKAQEKAEKMKNQ